MVRLPAPECRQPRQPQAMSHDAMNTRWEGTDLLVLRDEREIDRIASRDIHRVILVCHGGDSPSDLRFAVVETLTDHILLPAASGIAGRVYFERQAFWAQRRASTGSTMRAPRCRVACCPACGCCGAISRATCACRTPSWPA